MNVYLNDFYALTSAKGVYVVDELVEADFMNLLGAFANIKTQSINLVSLIRSLDRINPEDLNDLSCANTSIDKLKQLSESYKGNENSPYEFIQKIVPYDFDRDGSIPVFDFAKGDQVLVVQRSAVYGEPEKLRFFHLSSFE